MAGTKDTLTTARNTPNNKNSCSPHDVDLNLSHIFQFSYQLPVAMPIQYELRRLFHLMNIQTYRNSTQKALILGAYFNSLLRS